MTDTQAIIVLLLVLAVGIAVVAVEVYRLNQAIGPIAQSTLVRTLSSV